LNDERADRRPSLPEPAAATYATFVTGVLTLITKSNWWSYGMAIGFISSLGLYVTLLVQAASPARQEQPGA
jgi:hypothetical protein